MTAAAEQAAFVHAVCADPYDVVPRLVYADWLTEHDEEQRADFIRLQVRLADLDSAIRTRAACHGLLRREKELWHATYGRDWSYHDASGLAGLATVVTIGQENLAGWPPAAALLLYRRGFVEQVSCRCDDWWKHGPAIVRAQPVTRLDCIDGTLARHTLVGRPYWREPPNLPAINWARGAHLPLGLEALPPLEDWS